MNTSEKAHGMDGTLVEPDWPPLTLAEVRALLTQFPEHGEPIRIVSQSPRPFSAASVVETSCGRIFVKRHHRAVRDVEGLLEEHRFLAHLLAAGAPVSRVCVNETGHTAIASGEWTYEVHEVSTGIDLYGEALSWTPFQTAEHAYSAGRMLASLHRCAQGYCAPPRAIRPLVASFSIFAAVDAATSMSEYLAARPALAGHESLHRCADQALGLLHPFHAQLLPLLPGMKPLWTHNDLHASNLMWSDKRPSAQAVSIIDFGLSDRTNAVHDLANAIERNIVEWLVLVRDPGHPEDVPVHLDHLTALLDGYSSVRPLSANEAAALAPMTALCHAEFALSEAEYYLGVLHSEEYARMAYDGWLVGHARWFNSKAGRQLLAVLKTQLTDHRYAAGKVSKR